MFDLILIGMFLTMAIAVVLNIVVIRRLGQGMMNLLYGAYLVMFLCVAASQIFLHAGESGYYWLSYDSLHVWLHIMVYAGLLALLWGVYRTRLYIRSADPKGIQCLDKAVFASAILVTLVPFWLAPTVEERLAPLLADSVVSVYGLHHFLVFLGLIIAGWYLIHIKGAWGVIGKSFSSIIAFLVLNGLLHGWEVVTESVYFKLFTLHDTLIEGIELLFLFPAVLMFTAAQWFTLKAIR